MKNTLQNERRSAVQDEQNDHEMVDPPARDQIAAAIRLICLGSNFDGFANSKDLGKVIASYTKDPVLAEQDPKSAHYNTKEAH